MVLEEEIKGKFNYWQKNFESDFYARVSNLGVTFTPKYEI